jgi:hypothetical protein
VSLPYFHLFRRALVGWRQAWDGKEELFAKGAWQRSGAFCEPLHIKGRTAKADVRTGSQLQLVFGGLEYFKFDFQQCLSNANMPNVARAKRSAA